MNCMVCNKKLRSHNKIGTCRKHRSLSKVRQEYENKWQSEHKEQYAEAKKQWTKRNAKYFRDYRNQSAVHKLAHSLRVRIRRAVKTGSATKNLGCTVSELKAYLENKFQSGMTWENYGKWEIDHIKPLSRFDLTDQSQLSLACHYSNLQPLWKEENIRKYNKLDYCPKSVPHSNE